MAERQHHPTPEIFKPSPAIKVADADAFVEQLRTTPVPPEVLARRRAISKRVDKIRESIPLIHEDLKQAARRELEERGR